MKNLKWTILAPLMIAASIASAAPTAGYYRVWQGFKRSSVTTEKFNDNLPAFMNWTVSLYGETLNQYIVGMPPVEKPSFIPDEFALIALSDEASYKKIRATTEGQAYGEAHWQIFEKETSKSAPLNISIPAALVPGQSYDMIGTPVNWNGGYTVFFIGVRRSDVSVENFLSHLAEHVIFVTETFRPMGLTGYIAIANENYEVAYMNWESKEAADAAFDTMLGDAVRKDAEAMMTFLQFTELKPFNGSTVIPGEAYSTVK